MDPTRPTMNDVAAAAGVGLKTVSRVVNNQPGVRPELAARVEQAIVALQYRRNDIASSLRSSDPTVSVGLIIEDLGNPFYSAIARGVETVLAPVGHLLLMGSSERNAERERELVLDLSRRRVKGMIVVPAADDHAFLQREVEFGLQLVFLDRPVEGVDGDTVVLDNRGGTAAAVERLIALGNTRIGFVAAADHWTVRQRLSGYRQALTSAGLPVDDSLVRLDVHTVADAAAAVSGLLDLDSPPTAIFGVNNLVTIGILMGLDQRGRRLDVAGFDDIDTAPLLRSPLTLAAYDPTEVGRRAAELLLERLAGRRESRDVVIPTSIKSYGAER